MKEIPQRWRDSEGGLHLRYEVKPLSAEIDADSPHPKSDLKPQYFVLRLDHLANDRQHIQASHVAALAYAKACGNDRLAKELRELVAYHAGMLVAREIAEDLPS